MAEVEVDLLLKAFLNAGDDVDPPILDKVDVDFIPHPVSEFFQKAALGQELGKSGADWDEELGAPLEKGGAVTYRKGTLGYKLGVVRTEEVVIDGDRWVQAYDGAGELVDERLITE